MSKLPSRSEAKYITPLLSGTGVTVGVGVKVTVGVRVGVEVLVGVGGIGVGEAGATVGVNGGASGIAHPAHVEAINIKQAR